MVVADEEEKQRLDLYLSGYLPDLSRSRIQQLIQEGAVRIDGGAVKPSYRVRAGDCVAVEIPKAHFPLELQAESIPLSVAYEDGHLLVVDKPAGLPVHPGPGHARDTLVNALLALGIELSTVGGAHRPGIVHRLDKDTSGLMVAAKTEAAHRGLVAQFAARSVERRYHGLVWGRPLHSRGSLTGNIGRSPRNRKKMAVLKRGGRAAETDYQVLKTYRDGSVSLVECRLKTGRTHQIRVHMAEAGHSLLGDPLYGRGGGRGGSKRARALPEAAQQALQALGRQALHAKTLGFHHPVTQGVLQFDSELPRDMCNLIDSLE